MYAQSPRLHSFAPPRSFVLILILLLALTGLLAQPPRVRSTLSASKTTIPVAIAPDTARLPLSFVPNAGLVDPVVQFQVRSMGGTLFFTTDEVVLSLATSASIAAQQEHDRTSLMRSQNFPQREQVPVASPAVVRLRFLDTNPATVMAGVARMSGTLNYIIGNNPAQWRTNLPTYAGIVYRQLYPGIDLAYNGTGRQLKGTYVVAPGTDSARIRWRYDGATAVRVDETTGDLRIDLPGAARRTLTERAPVAWQIVDGQRVSINARYIVDGDASIGFALGGYDTRRAVTIDPTLEYATYLGGGDPVCFMEGDQEICDITGTTNVASIAVDATGNTYITGFMSANSFPTTPGAYDATINGGGSDVFITKLSPDGSTLMYSTLLGGGDEDFVYGKSIAVDSAGNAYVAGGTRSTDFPTTVGAYKTNNPGGTCDGVPCNEGFVTKLNATGSALVYSTYIGGSNADYVDGMTIDNASNTYVTGATDSPDFPTTVDAFSSTYGGGDADAFVAKLNATGTGLVYSTFLGGTDMDISSGMVVDGDSNVYVTGSTYSSDFPTTPGTLAPTPPPTYSSKAFVTKLNAAGSALVYSTFLGGTDGDAGHAIAVDSSNSVYVTGETSSADFPTVNPYQATKGASIDLFLTKLAPSGSTAIYSTFFGADYAQAGRGIAVDSAGNAYIIGNHGGVGPGDFPTTPDAFAATPFSSGAFVTAFDTVGMLRYSTLLPGTIGGNGIAVDTTGAIYVTGQSPFLSFPTTPGAYQPTRRGLEDAFVVKIRLKNTPTGANITVTANGATVTFGSVSSAGNTTIAPSTSGPTVPAGFTIGTTLTFFDISTTASYAPPVNVCLSYDPTQFSNPNDVRLLHYEAGEWLDVTTSHDTTNHLICGRVNSLSPFVVAQSKYDFNGFYQPVDAMPLVNVVKAGSAVPVKFTLGGNQGLTIFDTGYPKSQAVSCDSTVPMDNIEETVTAGTSSLSYDTVTGQYIYVWKTDKSWTNSCRQLVVKLNDLSYHRANFKFTK